MNVKSVLGLANRKLLANAATKSHPRKHQPRLTVTNLEERTVPATLPAPVVDYSAFGFKAIGSGFAPMTVMNPLNPDKMVTVYAGGATGTNIEVLYSTGGGANWSAVDSDGLAINGTTAFLNGYDAEISDPETDTWNRYTNVGQPYVAFDRFNNFFIVNTETDADRTSGRIVVRKYNFTNLPTPVDLDPSNTSDPQPGVFTPDFTGNPGEIQLSKMLYKWQNGDQIYNLNIAVDSNRRTTDPLTQDPNVPGAAGKVSDPWADFQATENLVQVFVSWNTNDQHGSTTPADVRQSVSDDAGLTFGAVVTPTDFFNTTMPNVIFTPGRVGGNLGGTMVTTYVSTGGTIVTDTVALNAANAPKVTEATNTQNKGIGDALPAPDGQDAHVPVFTYYPITVPANTGLTAIDHIAVGLALYHNDLSQIRINLIRRNNNTTPADGTTRATNIIAQHALVFNGQNALGVATGFGIAGTNLGLIKRTANSTGLDVGTWFSDSAIRSITNGTGTFSGVFQPEGNQFSPMDDSFAGVPANLISGQWLIEVIDFRNNGAVTPSPVISSAQLQINQDFDDRVGGDVVTGGANASTPTGTGYGSLPAVVPAGAGIGPHVAMAMDNTMGAFSPYQGRIYIAYNSGASVLVKYSDSNGTAWSNPVTIGAGFNPAITVDSTTGTVIVSYYSTIYDPAGIRAVTMVSTSVNARKFGNINAGEIMEFSAPAPINARDTTYDQIRSKTIDVEAIPSNGPALGTGVNGYGNNMGLVAFGGEVTAVYTGNMNTSGAQIRNQAFTIAAGPRVVDGDMGAIFEESEVRRRIWDANVHNAVFDNTPAGLFTYNDTLAADGRRQFTGFVVEFDRVIDVSTFTAADIRVIKRRPSDDPGATPTGSQIIPVTQIVALDDYRNPLDDVTQYGSKRFLIRVAPQSDVATYSYAIGSEIADRIRGENFALTTPLTDPPFNSAGPVAIPDDDGIAPGNAFSTIAVPASVPAGRVVDKVTVRVNITHPLVEQLSLVLRAPNGDLVPLVAAGPTATFGSGATGANFTDTVFDDAATNLLEDGTAPYTDSFQVYAPDVAALSSLFGIPMAGQWRLLVQDEVQNFVGTINNWSLTIDSLLPSLLTATGNQVDQNSNSFENQGDADSFSVPKPNGVTPFVLPYVVGALPISIPGPRLIDSKVPGQPVTDDNLVSNAKVSSIDLQFDRTMSAASFTAADILRITGPLGDINKASVAVTPISGFDGTPTGADSKFFRVSFAEQKVSGTYHIQFSSSISQAQTQPLTEGGAAVAIELDTNANAGKDTLFGASNGSSETIKTYNASLATPTTIAANAVTNIPITVNDAYLLKRALAEISITHTNTRDLDIRLISPNNTVVLLSSNAPANGSDDFGFTNTTFDDGASTPIQLGAGGFANASYNPIQPLAQLIGVGSGGTWRLSITNKGATTGTVSKFRLTFTAPVIGSGLGEPVGDQTPVSFRIFNASGSSVDAKGNWTPVGPAQANNTNATGRTSTIAVDPTDPSGNIVYVGGASGGVWKTTNFLTRDPAGPTWVPLTDFGPTNAINVGSISLFNTTGDPNDTVILVGTGSEDLNRIDKLSADQVLGNNTPNEYRFDGIGFLISTNGGKDWNVFDSSNNYDPALQKHRPVSDPLRDHVFVGATVKKVLFEKNPNVFNSLPIMYAVVGRGSAGAAAEGLWRSIDGGRNWVRLFNSANTGSEVSDFVLSEGSALASSGFRPTTGYLAVEGVGVFRTTNLDSVAPAFIQLNGGLGRPTINTGTITTSAPTDTPLGANGRVVLAVPTFVDNDPLANAYYRNWVFAAVADANGYFDGIYVSKDAGLGNSVNWTKIKLTGSVGPDGKIFGFDDNGPDVDVTDRLLNPGGNPIWGGANHSMSLATDPTDPNILYFGSDSLMRIDITQVIDPYSLWMYSNTNNDAGAIRGNTDGSITSGAGGGGLVATNPNTGLASATPGDGGQDGAINGNPRALWNFVNLVKDPYNPFTTNTALSVTNMTNFNNTGGNVEWSVPDTSRAFGNGTGVTLTERDDDFDWISNIVTIRDPLTGKARVLYTSDESIRTFVSEDDGTLNEVQGFNQPDSLLTTRVYSAFAEGSSPRRDNYQLEGSRNGNIQVGRLYSGEAQPSLLAASISQSFLAAAAHRQSDVFTAPENTLSLGNDNWGDIGRDGRTNYVASDQTGSGNIYILRRINDYDGRTLPPPNPNGLDPDPVDFFQISVNGNPPLSFTNGLFRNALDAQGQGQWDNTVRRFAVNPVDKYGVLLGSAEGRLYRTDGSISYNWQVVAEPAQLDGSYTTALAFGSPQPTAINLNNHIYAGTEDGSIFVTQVGGGVGNWLDISAGLDGSNVVKIVPNPTRGSHEAYAVTEQGVFHMVDYTSTDPLENTWQNITTNLLTLTIRAFGDTDWEVPFVNNQPGAVAKLTSLAVDWRPLTAPTPALPVLYVAGDGGVVRSVDAGATWARYTEAAQNATSPGGGLPIVKVSDIDLSLGNIDPNTGRTLPSGSPDMLVATTLGRGVWALPLGKPQGVSGPIVESATPTAPQDAVFDTVTIKFDTYIDLTTFSVADIVITAPDGSIVPVLTLTDTTNPPPNQANLHNEWEITFAPQSQEGVYTIKIGPDITDGGGTLMNQNQNSTNGEASDFFLLQVVYGRNDIADLIKDTYRNLLSPRDSNGAIVPATARVPSTAEYLAASTALEKARLKALSVEAQKLLVNDEPRKEMVRRLFTITGGAVSEIGNLMPGIVTPPAYFVNQAALAGVSVTNMNELYDFLVSRIRTKKTTPQTIIAEIMATDEYVAAAGGTPTSYLTKVYADLFAGAVPAVAFNMLPANTQSSQQLKTGSFSQRFAMVKSLTNGTTVTFDHDANVATAALKTGFRQHLTNLAYTKYVGRLPTAAELKTAIKNMNKLGSTTALAGMEHMLRQVLASQGYFNQQAQKLELAPGYPDTGLRTNRAWVDAIYEDRYGRAAGPGGFFSDDATERTPAVQRILNNKDFVKARSKFFTSVVNGTEFRTVKASEFYRTALNRNALPTEIDAFVKAMKSSTQTLDKRLATIVASQEFYNNAALLGGSLGTTPNERFVMAMYQRLLGRQPTPAELSARLANLSSGRYSVAFKLITGQYLDTGDEYRTKTVTAYYNQLMGRAPTPAELADALLYLKKNRWEKFLLNKLFMTQNFYEIDQ